MLIKGSSPKQVFYPRKSGGGLFGREYLDERVFVLMLLVAFFLHVIAMYIWHIMPRSEVIDIPVRILNIKLGDIEDPATPSAMTSSAQPSTGNKDDVESAIAKMMQTPEMIAAAQPKAAIPSPEPKVQPEKSMEKPLASVENDVVETDNSAKNNAAKQFVRNNSLQAQSKGLVSSNSSDKEAELMSRYEQLISLWIEKFKLYPPEARSAGMAGETVVRIRIDRQGNIRYYILERSTGHQALDRAAIEMVKRANPVPAVPHDYPRGNLIEFLIPVKFNLQ